MSTQTAPDDVVGSWQQAAANDRAPLLVLDPLAEFLERNDIGAGPLSATPVGEGHSNVTYALQLDGPLAEVIIRRPPRPPLPPSAHDVLREARLLSALQNTVARVPRVLGV